MAEHHAGFSAELRLLLDLLRAGLATPRAAPAAVESLDWSVFLTLVERHRLAPFLQRSVAPQLAASTPPAVARHVARLAATVLQRALAQAAVQFELTRRIESAGIDLLTVKGLVLAQQLHGGPGGRHVGDIDLVVRPADVPRAETILREAGFVRTRPAISLTPRQTAEYQRLKPEYEYVNPSSRLRLELLWRLEGLPHFDELWPRAVTCEVAGRVLHTPSPDDNALYLFQHGARHGWFRLFWLLDVALLLRDAPFDWSSVVGQARRHGMERSLLQGAVLTEELLGIACPPALRPDPRERSAVEPLVADARRQLVRTPFADEGVVEWTRQLAYRVRLQRGLRAKAATVTPHLFSPLSWETCPLPDRWFFLYYFASPFLWIWRRIRR